MWSWCSAVRTFRTTRTQDTYGGNLLIPVKTHRVISLGNTYLLFGSWFQKQKKRFSNNIVKRRLGPSLEYTNWDYICSRRVRFHPCLCKSSAKPSTAKYGRGRCMLYRRVQQAESSKVSKLNIIDLNRYYECARLQPPISTASSPLFFLLLDSAFRYYYNLYVRICSRSREGREH